MAQKEHLKLQKVDGWKTMFLKHGLKTYLLKYVVDIPKPIVVFLHITQYTLHLTQLTRQRKLMSI